MTESEWLTATDPKKMVEHISASASDRKGRLLIVAGCHHISHLMSDAERAGVDAAELFADGHIPRVELERRCNGVEERMHGVGRYTSWVVKYASSYHRRGLWNCLDCLLWAAMVNGPQWLEDYQRRQGSSAQRSLLRCIFGNPFRPVAFAESWRTETAVSLAAGVYAERAFDRLPILADALEEAGCDHPDVLTHCRGPGPHARGCWVVDGLLGKS